MLFRFLQFKNKEYAGCKSLLSLHKCFSVSTSWLSVQNIFHGAHEEHVVKSVKRLREFTFYFLTQLHSFQELSTAK
jgi:hypothetical protein